MIALIFVKLAPFLAVATGSSCNLNTPNFFFLPPWYEYLPGKIDALGQCAPSFSNTAGTFQLGNIWLIGLAILDILLRVAGFVAVISIIVAGVQHQFTGGNPEKAAAARRRIWNSLIGLGIVLTATAGVTFLGNQLGG